MINSKKIKKSKSFFTTPKFFAFSAIVLIVVISVPLGKSLSKQRSADREIAEIQREIEMIENKNQDLSKLVSYLQTDDFIEEQARLNLNLKKQGENVVVIRELASSTQSIETDTAGEQRSNYQKWIDYFIK